MPTPTSTESILIQVPPRFINLNFELIEYDTTFTTTQNPHYNTPTSGPLPRHHRKATSFLSACVREAIFILIGFYTSIIVTLIFNLAYDILHEKDIKLSDISERPVESTNMSKKVEYLQTLKSKTQESLSKESKKCKQRWDEMKEDITLKTIMKTSLRKATSVPWKRICNDYWLFAFAIIYTVIVAITPMSLPIELSIHWLGVMWHWGAAIGFLLLQRLKRKNKELKARLRKLEDLGGDWEKIEPCFNSKG